MEMAAQQLHRMVCPINGKCVGERRIRASLSSNLEGQLSQHGRGGSELWLCGNGSGPHLMSGLITQIRCMTQIKTGFSKMRTVISKKKIILRH